MVTQRRKPKTSQVAAALRRRAFVLELLKDPQRNATAAAIAVGYSPRSAKQLGSRLMQDPEVQADLARFEAVATVQAIDEAAVDKARVLKELERIALSDVGEVLDFSGQELRLRAASEIPESARRALKAVKVKRRVEGRGAQAREVEVTEFEFWNKVEALVRLGSELGLTFPQRHELTGAEGGPIEHRQVKPLTDEERRARLTDILGLQREGATP